MRLAVIDAQQPTDCKPTAWTEVCWAYNWWFRANKRISWKFCPSVGC